MRQSIEKESGKEQLISEFDFKRQIQEAMNAARSQHEHLEGILEDIEDHKRNGFRIECYITDGKLLYRAIKKPEMGFNTRRKRK